MVLPKLTAPLQTEQATHYRQVTGLRYTFFNGCLFPFLQMEQTHNISRQSLEKIFIDLTCRYAHMFQHVLICSDHLGWTRYIVCSLLIVWNGLLKCQLIYPANKPRPVAWNGFCTGQCIKHFDTQPGLRIAKHVPLGNLLGGSIDIEKHNISRLVCIQKIFQHASERCNADTAGDKDQFLPGVLWQCEVSSYLAREHFC